MPNFIILGEFLDYILTNQFVSLRSHSMSKQKSALSSLVSAAIVATAIGATAHAADNPFTSMNADASVQLAGMEGKCGEGKCGEGKCGASSEDDSAGTESEGKCGEGKCGSGSMGDHEQE